jgi:hypothetical protein
MHAKIFLEVGTQCNCTGASLRKEGGDTSVDWSSQKIGSLLRTPWPALEKFGYASTVNSSPWKSALNYFRLNAFGKEKNDKPSYYLFKSILP